MEWVALVGGILTIVGGVYFNKEDYTKAVICWTPAFILDVWFIVSTLTG